MEGWGGRGVGNPNLNSPKTGGGDGGILHALLKAQPKSVVMIDLDEMVIAACRKHLRGVCGDALDSLKGPSHEVGTGRE